MLLTHPPHEQIHAPAAAGAELSLRLISELQKRDMLRKAAGETNLYQLGEYLPASVGVSVCLDSISRAFQDAP